MPMNLKIILIFFCLLANLSAPQAHQQEEKPQVIELIGRYYENPEISLKEIRQIKGLIKIDKKKCINGMFSSALLREINLSENRREKLIGKRVYARGVLVDYIQYGASDPVDATISSVQNNCGNKYFVIFTSLSRLRQ
jgi:hypothetical protein